MQVTIHSLSLLLERIKTSALYIKWYVQNCIIGSPEIMDVVLGFIKESKFSSDPLRYCASSLAGPVSGTAYCVTPNSCKLNNSM